MFSESIENPEQEFAFADAAAAAGCKGYIGGYNISMEAIIERVTGLGMYYWGAERGFDEAFKDNEYYLGGFLPVVSGSEIEGNGDFLLGYELASALAKSGSKHVAYCNGGADFGIPMFTDRQAGFVKGIEDAAANGAEIVYDPENDCVSGWPGTDSFAAKMGQVLSGDYDAVAVSFSGVEVWYQPILDAGKIDTMKIAGVGAVTDSLTGIASTGAIAAIVYECEEVIFGNAVPMIINAVNGHADMMKGEEGYFAIETNRWTVTDAQVMESILAKHQAGEYYVTAEDMLQFFPEFNENASKQEMNDFYCSMTLDNAIAK
ncbi:MAG: hypothetical protein HUJ76_05875 [Parasporobacterium sp.]|nr:hypothetical protein [Parasporobacterium sp.]